MKKFLINILKLSVEINVVKNFIYASNGKKISKNDTVFVDGINDIFTVIDIIGQYSVKVKRNIDDTIMILDSLDLN